VPPQRDTRECPRGEPPILVCGPRLRHPLPAIRCRARRTNGRPCGQWVIRGGAVYPKHGGSAPYVRHAAAERAWMAEEMNRGVAGTAGAAAGAVRGCVVTPRMPMDLTQAQTFTMARF
jgi:hypothetical protein